ncbi:hypothetical protein GLAREA_12834 [Glarea lozoyensis ATCC 20868]|uniref:Uncharacterized protein n=1 Tax=Glarea lozoyensis (strain ATCC 20868 / MF5171) TaxID=1116229 RepID=S3DDP7_GLAL2|nr:uncharacterized protein GLAREA_12834 [Glarea lozoyensis ATCC 20868]EPE30111.1 hypothetical protein GLAREA_12834 [Glarea lozoyensis ATCC 20868]
MKEYSEEAKPRYGVVGKNMEDHVTAGEVVGGRHRRRRPSSYEPSDSSLSRTISPDSGYAARSSPPVSDRRRKKRDSTGQYSGSQHGTTQRSSDTSRRSLPIYMDARTQPPQRISPESSVMEEPRTFRQSFGPKEQSESKRHCRDSSQPSRSSSLRESRQHIRRERSPVPSKLGSARDDDIKQYHRRSMGDDLSIRAEREARSKRRENMGYEEYPPRRYPSPQQSSETNREKGVRFLEKAKWLALLPLALRAIHIVAEPSGGWEQYFQGDEKMPKAPRSRK